MIVSKTTDHIQIKIKMPNSSQEPPASSKAPNQDGEPKFGKGLYQTPVIISKSRSRSQTSVRNLQNPSKPQIRI